MTAQILIFRLSRSQCVSYLQVFDGLFGHQLFLLVPLHGAHQAGPDDADHGLLGQVGFFHLLFGEDDNLNTGGKHSLICIQRPRTAEGTVTNIIFAPAAASPPSEGHRGTSAPGAPSAAPCGHRWIAGCGRSRTAPSARRL